VRSKKHCKDTDGNNREEQKGFHKKDLKGTMINKVYTGKVVSNKMEKNRCRCRNQNVSASCVQEG
jgi:hypothetical protein